MPSYGGMKKKEKERVKTEKLHTIDGNTSVKQTASSAIKEAQRPAATLGDTSCYLYFDCEFTGLQQITSLISIAVVDVDGRSFYAEFNDYPESLITEDNKEWFEENVFKNLIHPRTDLSGDYWTMTGDHTSVAIQLLGWIDEFHKDKVIQFVGDVAHYDFVLLVDLLTKGKGALALPDTISPCCYDLNQDIASVMALESKDKDNPKDSFNNIVPVRLAFDIDRMDLAKQTGKYTFDGNQHNALADAYCAQAIHKYIWGID